MKLKKSKLEFLFSLFFSVCVGEGGGGIKKQHKLPLLNFLGNIKGSDSTCTEYVTSN